VDMECSTKTLLRDMKVLTEEYGCPLAYSRRFHGFYLKHPNWTFLAPRLLDANDAMLVNIGTRIGELIFPDPVRTQFRQSAAALLDQKSGAQDNSDELDSLRLMPGLFVQMDSDVFSTVFTAWRSRLCVDIDYTGYNGEYTSRRIEPHALVFFNNAWYVKGICRLRKDIRIFALHRMLSATLSEVKFKPSDKIISSVTVDDFLGFQRISNVKISITPRLRGRLQVYPLHSKQKFHKDDTVELPEVSRETLFPFLLAAGGDAVIISPKSLRDDFAGVLKKMIREYEN
ncbi:MAG: WYL domain-containing protein, partial [Victivallales bacterium]|nr:WYL domain-containing protein [Victivallales bacterium]